MSLDMKVAYCSLLLPEEKKLSERSKKRLSGISLHKFTHAVIGGLDKNLPANSLSIFNIINTVNYPNFPDLVFKTEKWSHIRDSEDWHIGYINLFGIKYITQSIGLYLKLKKWINSIDMPCCIICVHHIYFPSMFAAYLLKQKYRQKVRICLITGDMTGKFGLVSQYKPNLKQYMITGMNKMIDAIAKRFDCFVFATRAMASAFGVENKPFVVLECAYLEPEYLSLSRDIMFKQLPHNKKIIFYAGALREEYGIPHLLRAFSMIDSGNYCLWLAGDGNAVPIIKKYPHHCENIEDLGFLTPHAVEARQQVATVLISPRTSQLEFVKYSFPSKTMECLASGKPYIAHKLPCDPPEYAHYIQYASNESDEALKDKIVEICNLSQEERDAIGARAKDFVLKEKNPYVMTKRIVKMWKAIVNER